MWLVLHSDKQGFIVPVQDMNYEVNTYPCYEHWLIPIYDINNTKLSCGKLSNVKNYTQ